MILLVVRALLDRRLKRLDRSLEKNDQTAATECARPRRQTNPSPGRKSWKQRCFRSKPWVARLDFDPVGRDEPKESADRSSHKHPVRPSREKSVDFRRLTPFPRRRTNPISFRKSWICKNLRQTRFVRRLRRRTSGTADQRSARMQGGFACRV